MCIKCHQGIPDDQVLQMVKQSLIDPHFEKWNDTSISHLAIGATGYNGEEVRELSNRLINNYITWKNNNPDSKDGTFFGNSTAAYAKKLQERGNMIYAETIGKNKEEIMHALTISLTEKPINEEPLIPEVSSEEVNQGANNGATEGLNCVIL